MKTACINTQICRIQNLLPDKCSICTEEFCVTLGQTPLLSCAICGQGSHDDCILNHFGIQPPQREEFGPEEALTTLNPTALPGVHYLCGACQTETIPDRDAGLLKRKQSTVTDDIQSSQSQRPVEEAERTLPLIDPLDELANSQNQTLEPDDDNSQQHQQSQTLHHSQDVSQGSQQAQNRNDQKSNGHKQNICRYYRQGTCKHGIAGRSCPHEHPPPCRKLMKHGNRGPKGCTSGSSCNYFHPKMCPTSMSKRECFKPDCKLKHIPGTKRKSHPAHETNSPHTTNSSTADKNYFLEAMQAMREEIMSALDQRLAALQNVHLMAGEKAQLPPQPATQMMNAPQQLGMAWPGYVIPGQNFPTWPQGQVVGAQQLAQGTAISTSQPTVLMQMPLRQ